MPSDTSPHNENSTKRRPRWALPLCVVCCTTAFAVLAVIIFLAFRKESMLLRREIHERNVQLAIADVDRQISAIKAGERHPVHLYCSEDTNDLLNRIAAMPEVEGLVLELTDVTDDGMANVATLRNLKSLVIYGGAHSVTDRGFARLKSLANLEYLALVNTYVTDQGLTILKNFRKLRSLTLFHEAWRGSTFTDAGLVHLKSLTNLWKLELSGGWVSDAAVQELRKSLPECSIKTKSEDY